jgi:DNA-directed RNA polymerase subunit omega
LAVLASKRAHEIEAGDIKMLSEYKSPKTVGMAMEEIAAGNVIIDPDSLMLEKDAEKMDKLAQKDSE